MPDTEQLRAMFSLSGSTSPIPATVCGATALGGCEGGRVGRRACRKAIVQTTANVKLTAATNGIANLFIRTSCAR